MISRKFVLVLALYVVLVGCSDDDSGGTAPPTNGPIPPNGFVYIPPGTFTMGSPDDEPGRFPNEGPQHQVTLTQGFYMSQYEVTEQWWHQVMDGTFNTSQLPKWGVSWYMAVQFCNELSLLEGYTPAYTINDNGTVTWNQSMSGYRLPTEAEWEYACRAGSETAFANGPLTGSIYCEPIDPNLDLIGWYCGNATNIYEDGRSPVGQKIANEWGLYDMHGNLHEWVWCGLRTYTPSSQVFPRSTMYSSGRRVVRGGSYLSFAPGCRSAFRFSLEPGFENIIGFRPVRSAF